MAEAFDRQGITSQLRSEGEFAASLFALSVAERLYPLIAAAGDGFAEAVRAAMNQGWRNAANGIYSANDERLESLVLNLLEQFNELESPVAEFAQDAMIAVAYALTGVEGVDAADRAGWAAENAYNALDAFVAARDSVDFNEPGAEQRVLSDAVIQSEFSKQRRDLVELSADGRIDVESLRERANADGVALWSPIIASFRQIRD